MRTAREFFEELWSDDKSTKYVVYYEEDNAHYVAHGYKAGSAKEIAEEVQQEYPNWIKIRVEGPDAKHVIKR